MVYFVSLLNYRDEGDFGKGVQERELGAPMCSVVLCHGCSRCQMSMTARCSTWRGASLFCFCLNRPSCLPELTRGPDPGADRSMFQLTVTARPSTRMQHWRGLSLNLHFHFSTWLLFFRSESPLKTTCVFVLPGLSSWLWTVGGS